MQSRYAITRAILRIVLYEIKCSTKGCIHGETITNAEVNNTKEAVTLILKRGWTTNVDKCFCPTCSK